MSQRIDRPKSAGTGRALAASAAMAFAALAAAPTAQGQLAVDYRGGELGGAITFAMRAAPGDIYVNIVSVTEGPTCFPPSHPVGCIDVDLGLFYLSFVAPGFFGTMPAGGKVESTFTMPGDPALDGFLLRDQMVKVVNGKLTEKSNLLRILFTLGDRWHDSVGTILDERAGVAAVALDDGRILLAGGGGTNLDACELYDPARQEFVAAAPLQQGRVGHSVTKLGDGRVLVVGGADINAVTLNSAELFDPVAGTWTSVGNLATARAGHSASLASDGRVLIAGGSTDLTDVLQAALSALKTTEVFDPATLAFTGGPNLARPHTGHSAVALANGDLVLAGGASFFKIFGVPIPEITNKAQTFTVASGFSSEINMQAGRVYSAAARLADGRVLFAGGIGGSITSPANLLTAELFDPAANQFKSTGSMSLARSAMSALLLPSSATILVAGGATGTDLASLSPTDLVERFDPATGLFTAAASLALPRAAPAAIVLPNELAALFGGVGTNAPAALYRD